MGNKIVKFPIVVITDKASEENFGVTPQLRGNVRELAEASREAVVSEVGILSSATDSMDVWVGAENIGLDGIPIFNNIEVNPNLPIPETMPSGASYGNVVKYNTLKGEGKVEVTSDENSIYVDAAGDVPEPEIVELGIAKSINGGILQEASRVNYSDFDPATGVGSDSAGYRYPKNAIVLMHNPEFGDAIGKILIKCTEKFNDDTTEFSIGTLYDPEYYVKRFNVPQE